jgi:hypothetical protein
MPDGDMATILLDSELLAKHVSRKGVMSVKDLITGSVHSSSEQSAVEKDVKLF